MNCYKIRIAYDGTEYCGWQVQPNGPTIQSSMMEAGKKFINDTFTVTGCSRTDSGVHALGFVAVLATEKDLNVTSIPKALNAYLPDDIVVHDCVQVDESFHPRYGSKSKHYRYSIYNGAYPIPQYMRYAYFYQKALDDVKMATGAKAFLGTHDFVGFSSVKTAVEDTVRTIHSCEVTRERGFIHIDVKGNGFLYNMVRIMAGTLLDVGRGKIDPADVADILAAKDRNLAKLTAPAKGLTLVEVVYD